tara:strand:- start:265 stop:1059 length:795 start_codon:yes stop_codon:yes gene_type:complete
MIITLTTDMGISDFYVASIKGSILKELPNANIVDISHVIRPFDILHASFVIKNCFKDFPKGTIHIIGINPEQNEQNNHVIIENYGQFFIGANNGIFSLLFDKNPDAIWEINLNQELDSHSFPTKNIFVKAACHIARGGLPAVIGKPSEKINKRELFRAIIDGNTIKGTVTYIDTYGNVITNITKELFNEIGKNRDFKIFLTRSGYSINKIHKSYGEVPEGERTALFSSSGFLEIAINKGVAGSGGGANQLFGLKINDTITIEFK